MVLTLMMMMLMLMMMLLTMMMLLMVMMLRVWKEELVWKVRVLSKSLPMNGSPVSMITSAHLLFLPIHIFEEEQNKSTLDVKTDECNFFENVLFFVH